jgi:hypothetical protein
VYKLTQRRGILISAESVPFLQRVHFLQKFKISVERGTPSCRNCRNIRFLQKFKISANFYRKGHTFRRNLRFSAISAEIAENLKFLQKGVAERLTA